MTGLIFLFIFCLILSAFFSGSEMAFVSANEFKMRELADRGNLAAKKAIALKNETQSFLTAILIGNNVVNITATAVLTYWFQQWFSIENEWAVSAVMVPVLVIFCEMVPKDYSRMHGQHLILNWAGVLTFFTKILHLPVSLILRSVEAVIQRMGVGKDKSIFVSETEFRMLIEESTTSGVLQTHERELIHMILDFERIKVASVMTGIQEVPKVSITSTIQEVRKIAKETDAKMLLVYEELPTLVVGMIYVFDLLFEEDETLPLKKYLRSPTFLMQETSVEKAFLTLQQRRQSYAVVIDHDNEVQGAVPIERLLAI